MLTGSHKRYHIILQSGCQGCIFIFLVFLPGHLKLDRRRLFIGSKTPAGKGAGHIQHPAGAAHDAAYRVIRYKARDMGMLLDAHIQPIKQRTATGQEYERIKAREYRARRKAQTAAAQPAQ